MELALWVPPVDHIRPLWCATVTFELLVTLRRKAQSDRVGSQHTFCSIEDQQPLPLVKAQTCHLGPVVSAKLACAAGQRGNNASQQDGATRDSGSSHCSMPFS